MRARIVRVAACIAAGMTWAGNGVAQSAGGAAQSAPGGAMARAAWMAGCWELRAGTRVTTEMWMPAAGGLMIGGSRTVANGVLREFEHLRLRARGDTLVYTAIPSGQRETDFRSTGQADSVLVFENLAHDFPQRIIYRRRGPDSLVARIEGPAAGGTVRGIDFPMARTTCTPPMR